MSSLSDEILRRRTFAIISHPDAGKTTLTEKLLLFGGAIQLAGEVKARGERRRVRSDWMAVERERGISVSSAVMSFEHQGLAFNLLDTPGHRDWTYPASRLRLGRVVVSKETVRRVGIERCQSRIEAEPRPAVGTEDRVRLGHIDVDVRVVLRWGHADALEFPHPDADFGDAAVVSELRIAAAPDLD